MEACRPLDISVHMPLVCRDKNNPVVPWQRGEQFLEAWTMADGLNHARAMRVAELVQDYQSIQAYLAALPICTGRDCSHQDGCVVLRQSVSEAIQLLSLPYAGTRSHPQGDLEREKSALRQVLMDASLRRHRAQKLYMRATAARRWFASRDAALKKHPEGRERDQALAQISQQLRMELQYITDSVIDHTLQTKDTAEGKWLAEDPSLAIIQQLLQGRSR